jgi:DNA-binding transcriptional regulator YdaS (Cro superfamily)
MGHEGRRPEADTGDFLVAIAMFHDIYKRVAGKLGVSKTTVGQVVRGRKSSPEISKAINSELRAIRDYLNNPPKAVDGG